MTTVPVELHRSLDKASGEPAIPEPWTVKDTIQFVGVGLVIFLALFAFMFSLGNM